MTAKLLAPLILLGLVAGIGSSAAAPPEDTGSEVRGSSGSAPQPEDELLLQRERYFYSSYARRDPFGSLLSSRFRSQDDGELMDIGQLTLVGVVWGQNDKFAVVQDKRSHVHVLRVGDRVVNGKVTEITREDLTVQHYFFGETANVTIHMYQGEGEQ